MCLREEHRLSVSAKRVLTRTCGPKTGSNRRLKKMRKEVFHKLYSCVISDFRRRVNEIFTLLECYAAQIGSYRRLGTTYRSDLPGLLDP